MSQINAVPTIQRGLDGGDGLIRHAQRHEGAGDMWWRGHGFRN